MTAERIAELRTKPYVELQEALDALTAASQRAERLEAEKVEHEQSFDLRCKADMRAIERWRGDDPAKELIMPDHADLCVWLLGECERLEAGAAKLREATEWALEMIEQDQIGRIETCNLVEMMRTALAPDAGVKLLEEHHSLLEDRNKLMGEFIAIRAERDALRQRVTELEGALVAVWLRQSMSMAVAELAKREPGGKLNE